MLSLPKIHDFKSISVTSVADDHAVLASRSSVSLHAVFKLNLGLKDELLEGPAATVRVVNSEFVVRVFPYE